MANGKGILIGGLAVLALYFANKGRAAVKLEYYFNTVDLSSLRLQNFPGTITTKLSVVNPTNTEQVLDAVFANVYLADGTQIGRIQQTTPQTILARNTTVVETPVILFAAGVGKLAGMVLQTQSVPPITIKGTITSMGVSIPFEQTL